MCEALSRQGHKCDVTYNLAEARARMQKKKYDVVVTDLMMEGKREGLELLAETRQFHPAPPVVLVTAHAEFPPASRRSPKVLTTTSRSRSTSIIFARR